MLTLQAFVTKLAFRTDSYSNPSKGLRMAAGRPSRLHGALALATVLLGSAPWAHAQTMSLSTKTGHQLGLTLSSYRYEEPGYMSLKANKIGLDYIGTYALPAQWPRSDESWFFRAELRYASGQADYSSRSSGSMSSKEDWYGQAWALLGRDFDMGGYLLAPYAGLSFRQLYNDLRGNSSSGASGYRRVNQSWVLPIGVTHKVKLAGASQLHTSIEYQHFLGGRQESRRSDASPFLSDLRLDQKTGHGLKAQVMWQSSAWSVGPVLNYWRVAQSETAGTPSAFEPRNRTYEIGLKVGRHF